MGKAIPYGVYDLFADEGWVSVGDHHDTAAFAVATIRRWWERMGRARYPDATRLMITADAGGSNAARSRLWKLENRTLLTLAQLSLELAERWLALKVLLNECNAVRITNLRVKTTGQCFDRCQHCTLASNASSVSFVPIFSATGEFDDNPVLATTDVKGGNAAS